MHLVLKDCNGRAARWIMEPRRQALIDRITKRRRIEAQQRIKGLAKESGKRKPEDDGLSSPPVWVRFKMTVQNGLQPCAAHDALASTRPDLPNFLTLGEKLKISPIRAANLCVRGDPKGYLVCTCLGSRWRHFWSLHGQTCVLGFRPDDTASVSALFKCLVASISWQSGQENQLVP
jgi:hypothetical protein